MCRIDFFLDDLKKSLHALENFLISRALFVKVSIEFPLQIDAD